VGFFFFFFFFFFSYFWNDVEIRLHVVRSLSLTTHELVVCSLDDGGLVTPVSPCRVIVGVRESPHGFELGNSNTFFFFLLLF
jgi:hypothetical protein